MKTSLLLLSIILSANLFGQEERGYLVIENKGKTACFFDESDPQSFINIYRSNFILGDEYHSQGYDYKKYDELSKRSGAPYPIEVIDYFGQEFVLEKTNSSFKPWLDSLTEVIENDELKRYEKKIFEAWLEASPGKILSSKLTKYVSFDDIHTIIIEYYKCNTSSDTTKKKEGFCFDQVHFVRDVENSKMPVISASMRFLHGFSVYDHYKLNTKENDELWSECKSIAMTNEKCQDKEATVIDNSEYSIFEFPFFIKNDAFYENRFQNAIELGTKYKCMTLERPLEWISDFGDVYYLYNTGIHETFEDWLDSLNMEFGYEYIYDIQGMVPNIKNIWEKARYTEDHKLMLPGDEKIYWWDFPNYSSHLKYTMNVRLGHNDHIEIKYNDAGRVFGLEVSNGLFLPLTSALHGKDTFDSFEKFKSKNELKWVKLLYSQKAGTYINDEKEGDRKQITNIVRTPKGFESGEYDLIEVYNEVLDTE